MSIFGKKALVAMVAGGREWPFLARSRGGPVRGWARGGPVPCSGRAGGPEAAGRSWRSRPKIRPNSHIHHLVFVHTSQLACLFFHIHSVSHVWASPFFGIVLHRLPSRFLISLIRLPISPPSFFHLFPLLFFSFSPPVPAHLSIAAPSFWCLDPGNF